jgi:hypothetical protein
MTWTGGGKGRIFAGALGVLAAAVAVAVPSASAGGYGVPGDPVAADCQPFLDDKPCLQPFPNNLFTKGANTPTGRRLKLPADAMPVNTEGVAIEPTEWNRNDGFSPGSMISVHVPGLDTPQALQNTGPVPLADLSRYKRENAPVVVIDQDTRRRWPIWAELDSNAASPEATNLLIHPAKNFKPKHRYVVALRDLEDASGNRIAAPRWFELLRDGGNLPGELDAQRKRYRSIFKALRKGGIERDNGLYEAWNFTVASRRDRTARLLEIRDDAFAQLGDRNLADREVDGAAPQFQVTQVEGAPPISEDDPTPDPGILRIVHGNLTVPCYLNEPGCPPGAEFNYASAKHDALPSQIPGNVAKPEFACVIPRAAQGTPARAGMYGHGLLGSASESVETDHVRAMAVEHNFIFCGVDSWGMSANDIPYDVTALQDLNRIPAVFDRLQQSAVNTQFLGRAMIHPNGLMTHPAFQSNGQTLIDIGGVYYDSNSQGGITGGMNTAIAPDLRRSVLGATGMNYGGMLLQRSSEFPTYATFLYGTVPGGGYRDDSLHPLVLSLAAQLWDRGEADGYAAHMTSKPLPGTPKHKVLMQIAYGDFQVTNYAAAVKARTAGVPAYKPPIDLPERGQDENLLYRIPAIQKLPFKGSALVVWDSGPGFNTPPPLTNTAPEEPANGLDPHFEPRRSASARIQKSEFLKPAGRVVDVCNGVPCHTDAFIP